MREFKFVFLFPIHPSCLLKYSYYEMNLIIQHSIQNLTSSVSDRKQLPQRRATMNLVEKGGYVLKPASKGNEQVFFGFFANTFMVVDKVESYLGGKGSNSQNQSFSGSQ